MLEAQKKKIEIYLQGLLPRGMLKYIFHQSALPP